MVVVQRYIGIRDLNLVSMSKNKFHLKYITFMRYGEDDTTGNDDIFYTTNNEDFGLFGSALNPSNIYYFLNL